MARIKAICISEQKGVKKHPIPSATLVERHGILGDAHAGDWHRQLSLLSDEDVDTMRATGVTLLPGDFAENILTEGIDLSTLSIGTRLKLGSCEVQVTQIGKQCHNDCEIKKLVGSCIMPTRGIFARVVKGGEIHNNDSIEVIV